MNILQQFQNLIDPSTALGAFLISLLAGIIVSFIGGSCYGAHIQKKNRLKAESAGKISQDVRKTNAQASISISKSNSISVGRVTGEIKQDVEE